MHKVSKTLGSHVRILGARIFARSKLRTEDTQVLGEAVQNSVVTASWPPAFVRPALTDAEIKKSVG